MLQNIANGCGTQHRIEHFSLYAKYGANSGEKKKFPSISMMKFLPVLVVSLEGKKCPCGGGVTGRDKMHQCVTGKKKTPLHQCQW